MCGDVKVDFVVRNQHEWNEEGEEEVLVRPRDLILSTTVLGCGGAL